MTDCILVTGGNGFLGSYVCAELAAHGSRVISYDLKGASGPALAVQQPHRQAIQEVKGQVTDLSRVLAVCREGNVRVVVHTAAFVEVGGSVEQPYFTYKVNTEGSIVMYEAARLLGLERVVLISSNAVYQRKEAEPIGERHSVFSPSEGNLAAHYGASKVAAEVIGLTYGDFNGIDFIALRMSSVYGFGMNLPLYVRPMVESAVDGRPCQLPSGASMRRDYTYVKDSARAVLLALQAKSGGLSQRVFNISGGRTYTAQQVAECVNRIVPGAKVAIGEGLSAIEASDIQTRGALDCSKAGELLGYRAEYDLERGIANYVRMYRAYRNNHHAREENHAAQ
jgi:UDP-glucose 4-epimerase